MKHLFFMTVVAAVLLNRPHFCLSSAYTTYPVVKTLILGGPGLTVT